MKKIILILFILCSVLAWEVAKEVLQVTGGKKDWDIHILQESSCDLQQGKCNYQFNDNNFTVEISPRPILINKKHLLTISGNFDPNDELWVDFKGIEKDMGYNRVMLKMQEKQKMGYIYLPSCELQVMTWRAIVIVKRNDKYYGFVYKLMTDKNHEI